ncbi:ankyrin repeat domain-containing protein 29-like [Periplaneta americana]|uniref:ankyrin repeat domain-containing protein 29-like n=1 Tax=Periplaneta americana TaxID=6978 RepID=UPI0037E9B472
MQFNEANPLAASNLGVAARIGDEALVERLLRNGRRVDLGDNRGWTPIHEAAAGDHINCLRLLLRRGRRSVNRTTMEGETPLMLACIYQCSYEVVLLLITHGANVTLGNNEDHTPLHEVCRHGLQNLAELLIEFGAFVNARDFNNSTPLHCAISAGNEGLVSFLINSGADITIQDECGRTPLFFATELGDWNVVRPILAVSASLDTRAVDGATPLMLAAQSGSLTIVEELLNRGANPDLAANDHTMALHLAIHSGNASVVGKLLEVTSRDAVLAQCTHPDSDISRSLCCLAIDTERPDVLERVLTSNLGNEILRLPAYIESHIPQNVTRAEFYYNECTPISFLLSAKFMEAPDDFYQCLELLLRHGLQVNTYHRSLPPLVAAMLQPMDFTHRCVDMLLEYGADIEHTTTDAGVPDALLTACITDNCSGLLKLLRAGSSGVPDDLLRRILMYDPIALLHQSTDMVQLLLVLGIKEQDLYRRLHDYYPLQDDESGASLNMWARPRLLSLQALSRIAVRKCLRPPFSRSLEQLFIPKCLKGYITYQTI